MVLPCVVRLAIANAKLAYDEFMKTFAGHRWENLKVRGACVQRPLWASTSTKNPAYPDTIYVDNLIGPDTVNTVPPATLDAFREHGAVSITLTRDLDQAHETIAALESAGISMDQVTQELEDEGVKAFAMRSPSYWGLLMKERRKASLILAHSPLLLQNAYHSYRRTPSRRGYGYMIQPCGQKNLPVKLKRKFAWVGWIRRIKPASD